MKSHFIFLLLTLHSLIELNTILVWLSERPRRNVPWALSALAAGTWLWNGSVCCLAVMALTALSLRDRTVKSRFSSISSFYRCFGILIPLVQSFHSKLCSHLQLIQDQSQNPRGEHMLHLKFLERIVWAEPTGMSAVLVTVSIVVCSLWCGRNEMNVSERCWWFPHGSGNGAHSAPLALLNSPFTQVFPAAPPCLLLSVEMIFNIICI